MSVENPFDGGQPQVRFPFDHSEKDEPRAPIRVNVPDFRTAPAGEVTDSAADRFVMPSVPNFSEAPASAAAETPGDTFNFGQTIEEGEK